jgi:uncharacterized membrane protein YbhN (UPF0104 family)
LRVIKPLLIIYYFFPLSKWWFSYIFKFCLSFILLSVLFYFCRSVELFVLIPYLGTLVVLIFRYGTKFILIFRHGTIFVLFRFVYLFRFKFGADSITQWRTHLIKNNLQLTQQLKMKDFRTFVTYWQLKLFTYLLSQSKYIASILVCRSIFQEHIILRVEIDCDLTFHHLGHDKLDFSQL